ncbi:MAG: hypothetical protein Fur0010_26000 [Bdellovibrio sp.]
MRPKRVEHINNQEGQTAVEYVLLLMVVVIIIFNVLGIVRERFLGDPENCDTAGRKSIACIIAGKFNPESWKYYTF